MLSDYSGKKAKYQMLLFVIIPLLAIFCIFKILAKRQPVDVDSLKTDNITQKEYNGGD